MTRRGSVVALVAVLAILLTGCASFGQQDTRTQVGKAVIISSHLYDATMNTLGQLYQHQMAPFNDPATREAKRQQAVAWANRYRLAATGVLAWVKTGQPWTADVEAQLAEMEAAVTELRTLTEVTP